MPEVWGEDASVFNPYRWFKENGENVSYSPFSKTQYIFEVAILVSSLLMPWHVEYHSWNAGPRSCLGRALATYEGIAVSTAIIQRFDVILTDDSKTYEPLAALNMVCFSFSRWRLDEMLMKYFSLGRESEAVFQ